MLRIVQMTETRTNWSLAGRAEGWALVIYRYRSTTRPSDAHAFTNQIQKAPGGRLACDPVANATRVQLLR
jgi:hypothetical protein